MLSSRFTPRIRTATRTLLGCVLAMGLAGITPAHAQSVADTYFWSGGHKHALTVSSRWQGIQLDNANSATAVRAVADATGEVDTATAPILNRKKSVLLMPLKLTTTTTTRQFVRGKVKAVKGVRHSLRVFDNGTLPIVETDEILVQFKPGVSAATQAELLAPSSSTIVESLRDTPNGYLIKVADPETTPATSVANTLYESGYVVFSHPNYIWPKKKRFVPNDPLFANQWNMNNTGAGGGTSGADVEAEGAWDYTRGSSSIVIAVIDDGIDIDHEDFQGGKVLPGYDFADNTTDPRPKVNDVVEDGQIIYGDDHGTACAGIATANGNNGIGVTGIAPNCKLLPIRLLGDNATLQDEHDSFVFAADNGADVISCSWGPPDGTGQEQPLPDSTKQGIDYAVSTGRGGKGCPIFFASGNGSESSDLDGYASYTNNISVAASTDSDAHAFYSDYGSSVDLAAPSNGGTQNIETTDRTGVEGYSSGNYNDIFGGTSASAPMAAGIAALVLSVNPNLTRLQVLQLMEAGADKVGNIAYADAVTDLTSPVAANATTIPVASTTGFVSPGLLTIGSETIAYTSTTATSFTGLTRGFAGTTAASYASGTTATWEHSTLLGYGRVNAMRSVQLAEASLPTSTFSISGKVTLAGTSTGVAGIQVTATGNSGTATTASDGTYTLPGVTTGSTTVTASALGYSFSPTSQVVTVSANTSNINFSATAFTVTLVAPAANVTVSGTTALSATTNIPSVQSVEFQRRTAPSTISRSPNLAIPDDSQDPQGNNVPGVVSDTATLSGPSAAGTAGIGSVSVDIDHTFIGDLIVTLYPPSGTPIVLSNREGDNGVNLIKTYTNIDFGNSPIAGNWKMVVSDNEEGDVGTLISWGVTINPTWTTIATDTDGPTNGLYTASWNTATTPTGSYQVQALAVTSSATYSDIHNNVTVTVPVTTHSITGTITNGNNIGVPNVVVKRSGSSGTAITNSNGVYTFSGLSNNVYAVMPALGNSTFVPNERLATVNGKDATNVNFIAAPALRITVPRGSSYNSSVPGAAGLTANASGGGVAAVHGILLREAEPANGNNPAVAAGYWAGGNTWTSTETSANEQLATGTSSFQLPFPTLTQGKYYFQAIAIDNGGNRASETIPFYVDTTAPTLTETTPASNGSYQVSALTSAQGTAADSGGAGLKQVRFILFRAAEAANGPTPAVAAGYWAGGSTWTKSYNVKSNYLAASGTSSWSFSLPTFTAGQYTIRTDAIDKAGNVGSIQRNFTITNPPGAGTDTEGPTLTETAPDGVTLYTPSALTSASGTAADNSGSGLNAVRVILYRYAQAATGTNPAVSAGYWAGGSTWDRSYTAARDDLLADGTANWSYALPVLTPGRYTVSTEVWDNGGNTATITRGFGVVAESEGAARGDTTLPLQLSSSTAQSSGLIVLHFAAALDTASAADSANYAVQVNGAAVAIENVTAAANGTVTLNIAGIAGGSSVRVAWMNLRSISGQTLAPGGVQLTAK